MAIFKSMFKKTGYIKIGSAARREGTVCTGWYVAEVLKM